MTEANKKQIEQFKRQYCSSNDKRLTINRDFDVEILSYEELLPGNTVRSYATGSREINNGFIVFKVVDTINNIIYYPIFSDTVGRKLVTEWGMKLPGKMTVFTNVGSGGKNNRTVNSGVFSHANQRKDENRKMLQLIQFARSMMVMHVKEPQPMREPFKSIYENLEKHPGCNVCESDIKSVNTAISNYLNKPVNTMNENFTNLKQYIMYLQKQYPTKRLRNFDFEILRKKMTTKYPNETIVF